VETTGAVEYIVRPVGDEKYPVMNLVGSVPRRKSSTSYAFMDKVAFTSLLAEAKEVNVLVSVKNI